MVNKTNNFIDWVVYTLIKQSKPESIILFGSRARGDATKLSDFDIAVDGIGVAEGVWSEASNYIRDNKPSLHTVDLVRLDRVNPELRKRIQKEGIVLYKKNITK